MQNKVKNVSFFSLWLAIMVLFFHAAIPHQQHLNSGFESAFQSLTVDAGSGNTPLNCQLFKDLSYELVEDSYAKSSNDDTFNTATVLVVSPFIMFGNNHRKAFFIITSEHPADVFFQDSIPVRGSPFIV